MTRYIIKVVTEATEKNDRYCGVIRTYYTAKCSATTEDCSTSNLEWFAKEFGYTTKAAALWGLNKENEFAKWEASRGYWVTYCELVEIAI